MLHESTSAMICDDDQLMHLAEDRDLCISMAWHGGINDLACVMVVSCALIKDFEAVVSYEGEQPEQPNRMFEIASEGITDAKEQELRDALLTIRINSNRKPWRLWG